MREFQIAVFSGDGIGPEIMDPCTALLSCALERVGGVRLVFDRCLGGAEHYRRTGEAIAEQDVAAAAAADAVLLAPMGLPHIRYPNGTEVQPHLELRDRFGLYAGVRPVRSYIGVPTPLADSQASQIDYVLVRESTEGIFAARKMTRREGEAVLDTIKVSRSVSERLFHFTFDLARSRAQRRGRVPRVTCIDKANVIPSLAYFREIFLEVAQKYPDVQADCQYVDAAAMRLVCRPWEFDVMVTENMFGDILSDVGAGLVGGVGMAPSAEFGDRHGVFQVCHGTAPDIAGQGLANPLAMIMSGAMMLEWLGERHDAPACSESAALVYAAIERAMADGDLVTIENGGSATTAQMTARILSFVRTL